MDMNLVFQIKGRIWARVLKNRFLETAFEHERK
jgi:hypothetical protein